MKTDKSTLFEYCSFLVLLSTPLCSQNINKQNMNLADETLTDYSFLSRYHCTKSKNYSNRRYRTRQWIPMFIGTPCIWQRRRNVPWQSPRRNSLEILSKLRSDDEESLQRDGQTSCRSWSFLRIIEEINNEASIVFFFLKIVKCFAIFSIV